MSSYHTSSLSFYNNKIVVEDSGSDYNNMEVMMDWEDSMMSASSAYVTQNGGDILEIGFGMGISAGYMHSHSISSHTIIENHPQIIPKAVEWAEGKSNVTIISQSWHEVTGSLGTYDGIFYDVFGDDNWYRFSSSLSDLTKPDAKITCFNSEITSSNPYRLKASYETINVTPGSNNTYFNNDTYYLPKVEI